MNGLKHILSEAKRRRVFRTAGVYLVAVWGLSQGAVELAPLFGAPDWAVRAFVVGAIVCLPVVVVLSWMFDLGLSGVIRDPHDVLGMSKTEADLATMPTIIGGDGGAGAIIARWKDADGEHDVLFTKEFLLGRGVECRVRFYDPLVSRKHARVFYENDTWQIEDLGSQNGTIVNGERVERQDLAEKNAIEMNIAGPVLHLEIVAPGAKMHEAMQSIQHGQTVAHLRGDSLPSRGAR